VEENQRIVKLVFKPTLDKIWNINMLNVSPKINAKYATIDQPFNLGNQVFNSTLKVDIQNFFSLVDDRVKYDIYAKNVGLIYKYFKDNTIANFDKNTIKKGKELYYTLVSYGIE
jgi:phosphate starvation-inducible membrane PsiE